jgi:hypothetical protein
VSRSGAAEEVRGRIYGEEGGRREEARGRQRRRGDGARRR